MKRLNCKPETEGMKRKSQGLKRKEITMSFLYSYTHILFYSHTLTRFRYASAGKALSHFPPIPLPGTR